MLAQFKPVAYTPAGYRRQSRRVPRWLVLLLTGIVLGALAVVVVQEKYLPPRLSAGESASLRASFEKAESERLRLTSELQDTARRLSAALADRKGLSDELASARQSVDHLRDNVNSLVAALPPDPRGGAVQIRAARFSEEGGKLLYDAVLSRDRAGGKALSGVVQIMVAGSARRGPETTVKLPPVAVSLGSVENVRGGLPLPEGFSPRQATIHVLDRPDGKLLGMRVLNIQ
jgi:hypothetical protein